VQINEFAAVAASDILRAFQFVGVRQRRDPAPIVPIYENRFLFHNAFSFQSGAIPI
jgi:hypothetical protein